MGQIRYIEIRGTEAARAAEYRWDTPSANRGQILEVSYSRGPGSYADEATYGDPYMRSIDHSVGPDAATYHRVLRGDRITLAGASAVHRDWIVLSQDGTWDSTTETWSLPVPADDESAATLLYEIAKRGMQWRAQIAEQS